LPITGAAAYWVSQNAVVAIEVPKLPLDKAIAMVRAAGGEAVLAHPGYLVHEGGVSLEALIRDLVAMGLSAWKSIILISVPARCSPTPVPSAVSSRSCDGLPGASS